MASSFLTYLAVVVSCAALLLNLASFVRAGKWKDTDEAKALVEKVNKHEARLDAGEERFKSLASKADISGVQAEVRALERAVDKVDAGVIRIEKILMDGNS